MKALMKLFAGGLGAALMLAPLTVGAEVVVSGSVQINAAADFYAPLAPEGVWVDVSGYGRCWHPNGVAVEWRPYCTGHWVWTDCGWYWESDEPWAWACYHYGNWVYEPRYGWVWAPGVEWSPAWVTWRSGGGYVGWAPIPPRGGLFVSVPTPPFFFVEVGRFHESFRPNTVIVNDVKIMNRTTVINNVRHENRAFEGSASRRVVIHEGPAVADIEKASGHKFQAAPIQEVAHRTRVPALAPRQGGVIGGREKPANERPAVVPDRSFVAPERNNERNVVPDNAVRNNPPGTEREREREAPPRELVPAVPMPGPAVPGAPKGPPGDSPRHGKDRDGRSHGHDNG